ncbi:MAG TPA: hypothetical protein VHH73_12765, partial [Verrucomicrobiae bacterium]|nr:hypothetical protein [Verrucomicrobiae bacterium]
KRSSLQNRFQDIAAREQEWLRCGRTAKLRPTDFYEAGASPSGAIWRGASNEIGSADGHPLPALPVG